MDKERSAENVYEKNEKKIERKVKKDKKKKESSREQEAPNSEKEDIADMEMDHIELQDKKKQKGEKDDEIDNKKGSREGKLAHVDGENFTEPTLDSAERKRKKREKKKNKNEKFENTDTEEVDAAEMVEKKKKKKNKKKSPGDDAIGPQDTCTESKYDEGDVQSTKDDGQATERKKKKKPKRKENYKDDSSAAHQDSVGNGSNGLDKIQNGEIENTNKKKKRKTKNEENGSDERQDNEVEHANKGKKRKTMLVEDGPSDATPNKSNKKVRFSGEDEVFTLPNDSDAEEENGEDNLADSSNTEEGNGEDNLVRGKRFTCAENEIVKLAVLNYIEERELGDEGLDMILNCSKHPSLKGCWKDIASAIPYRPYKSVYCRARILFMRSESRKWTQEEKDKILAYNKVHGNKWKALADELGKHRWHVKDTFRRIKLTNMKKGNWSQGEYQKLFDLVNMDLQLKLSEEKKSKHGMLRDNICWSAISDELSTRNVTNCCLKWYKQLTSPMVADGVWADSDDYRLLSALYSLDATCVEDVDWDDLIENRSGDACRKRWNQMVLHIGHYGRKSFAERVEVLAQRYCPNLLEAREIWDSKPRVP